MQVLGSKRVRERQGLVLIAHEDQRPKTLQAVAGQVTPAQATKLIFKREADLVNERCDPSQQNARARRMLGLTDQVGRDVVWPSRLIGDQNDLAGPGDAINID